MHFLNRLTVSVTGCIAATAASAQTSQAANEQPFVIAGGALDSAIKARDVYLERPVAATAEPGTACGVVEEYVELISTGKYGEVADLWLPDGVLMEPGASGAVRGREAIRDYYTGRIGDMRPTIVPVAYVGNRTDCVVELTIEQDFDGAKRFALASVDHFTVDEAGQIVRMVAFSRGQATRPTE